MSNTHEQHRYDMFKPKVATYSQQCALLKSDPAKPVAHIVKARLAERTRTADIRTLYQLASDYDSISPSLAAQLREIAARH